MATILDNINYLRFKQDFDYSKIPVIKNDHSLQLDPALAPNNWIDELRIANAMKNPPRPRQIPEVDLVELERKRKYGEKVDIQPQTLFERFRKMVIKVPRRDNNGNIMRDPNSNRPIMQNMTFKEMMNDPQSLLYRIGQLIRNVNVLPQQLQQQNQALMNQQAIQNINVQDFQDDVKAELLLIKQFLFASMFMKAGMQQFTAAPQHQPQTPIFQAREQAMRQVFNNVDDAVVNRIRSQMFSGQAVNISPEEIIMDRSEQQTENSMPIYSIVAGTYNNMPLQFVLPAYRAFVQNRYGDRFQFNFANSLGVFESTGGPRAWIQQAQQLPQPMSTTMLMGPGGIRAGPQMAEIGWRDDDDEQDPIDIKQEDTELSGIDASNITQLFASEGIQMANIGQYMDQNWYNTNIQTQSASHTDPNRGHRASLIALIDVLKDPQQNIGAQSFIDYARSNPTVASHISNGTIRIQIIANNHYALRTN